MTDELAKLLAQTQRETADWYTDYVDPGDTAGEQALYAVENERMLQKWIDRGEPHRVTLALRAVAKRYGETEKAHQSGYELGDVAWYSPLGLESLVPLALDPEWDGLTGEAEDSDLPHQSGPASEGGTLLAMVMDIRRVFHLHGHRHGSWDADTETGLANLEWVADKLGGDYPSAPGYSRGRREVMSNQRAQAITKAAA